ncbi:TIGR04086 family membrane protein [Frondihabitans peucedani]|uniref:Uncharacterized protein n=1 Tax=Frondihabitans peucedani TaxID=598626 RepID=A0ABP8E0A7_9MICO
MTDPSTPARGGDQTVSHTDDEAVDTVREEPREPAVDPAEPETARDEPIAEHESIDEHGQASDERRAFDRPEPDADSSEYGGAEPVRVSDPVDEGAQDAPAPRAETASVPPLSPPQATAAAAGAPQTGALHDDSALRAAEAARSGERVDPATEVLPSGAARDEDGRDDTGRDQAGRTETADVDDTRITPGTPRAGNAWTPPPAPASPTEYAAPATGTTPTPYAPPTQAMPASAAAPATSTTPISSLGTSPAENLGFADGIAGGDDGFTPEELAQRRSFRDEMAFRQKQEFAGINFGSAFFGWLAAVGLAGLLYLIAGGIAVAAGLAQPSVLTGSASRVESLGSAFDTRTLQITALVVFLVILFLSYFVGGFVASRMARFSGLKQGLAVWLWGLVMSIIAAVVGVVIGSQAVSQVSNMGAGLKLESFITVDALIAEGLIVVLSLGGALLGGLAGLRYHRRIDRFGLEEV